MTGKTHDAGLCERIRVLEERVKELEARPTYVPSTHWCYPGCWHYGTWTAPHWRGFPITPTITYGVGDTTSGFVISSTVDSGSAT